LENHLKWSPDCGSSITPNVSPATGKTVASSRTENQAQEDQSKETAMENYELKLLEAINSEAKRNS